MHGGDANDEVTHSQSGISNARLRQNRSRRCNAAGLSRKTARLPVRKNDRAKGRLTAGEQHAPTAITGELTHAF